MRDTGRQQLSHTGTEAGRRRARAQLDKACMEWGLAGCLHDLVTEGWACLWWGG